MQALADKGFSHKKGHTLFCLGDLIDGGTENEDALALLNEPWFFSILGNHEHLMLSATERLTEKTFTDIQHFLIEEDGISKTISVLQRTANIRTKVDVYDNLTIEQINWIGNGGYWFFDTSISSGYERRMRMITQYINTNVPIGREVITEDGTIGLLHAEAQTNDWQSLKNNISNMEDVERILWSRDKFNRFKRNTMLAHEFNMKGIDALLVGHTIIKDERPFVIQNTVMMDMGAKIGNTPLVLSSSDIISLVNKAQIAFKLK